MREKDRRERNRSERKKSTMARRASVCWCDVSLRSLVLSVLGGVLAFLIEGGFLSESFRNEEDGMRFISLKIVALLSAIANVAAFGGCYKVW